MNPFLHSTVAEPLSADDWRFFMPFNTTRQRRGQPETIPARPGQVRARTSVPQRRADVQQPAASARRRRRWQKACRMAMAAGLGLMAATGQAGHNVNVNVASVQELQAVRGIGPKTAELIVRERERSGPFESFEDFAERIRGIGPKRAQALREAGLTVSSTPPRGPLPPGMR